MEEGKRLHRRGDLEAARALPARARRAGLGGRAALRRQHGAPPRQHLRRRARRRRARPHHAALRPQARWPLADVGRRRRCTLAEEPPALATAHSDGRRGGVGGAPAEASRGAPTGARAAPRRRRERAAARLGRGARQTEAVGGAAHPAHHRRAAPRVGAPPPLDRCGHRDPLSLPSQRGHHLLLLLRHRRRRRRRRGDHHHHHLLKYSTTIFSSARRKRLACELLRAARRGAAGAVRPPRRRRARGLR